MVTAAQTQGVPGAQVIASGALAGAEQVEVYVGSTVALTTTAAIAALAGAGVSAGITNVNITTVGNGTLTAAGLVGGLINRSGPVAAFTDTTDTAALIVAALPSFVSGGTFISRIKNGNPYVMTLAGGTNVTLPLTNIIGPFQEVWMYGVVGGTAAAPTVTYTHLVTMPIAMSTSLTVPSIATLATNGAGVILGAAMAGGYVNRTTVAAAFTDTTDTAAAIIAGNPGLVNKIGTSFIFRYINSSTAVATIAGGTGVTVSAITTVGPGQAADYLVTYTAASTITMVGLALDQLAPATPTAGGATLTLTAANAGQTIRLDQAAGSIVTLPAASGSGNVYRFAVTVTTTSAKHAILAASGSDNMIGNVIGQTANTPKQFSAATASGFHSLQMPFAGTQPSGGFQGDWFELTDVGVNLWVVKGMYQAGTTPTTPFNTATS